jgi:metal-dependent amidase/aminoacylase/carboxypeptidase family protein
VNTRYPLLIVLAGLVVLPPSTPVSAAENPLYEHIQTAADAASPDLIQIRRQIHMHPEVSGEEIQTAALIAERLRTLGLEVQTGIGGHGVVGLLRGGKPGPVVAYRADMDAVPSAVLGDQSYKSQVEGVNHVCGHDAHVAIGLGIATVLAPVKDELEGDIKFIFQPAEENATGAAAMIADGVMENPAPERMFAVHVVPFPVGSVACLPGVGLSGVLPFEVRLESPDDLERLTQEVAERLATLNTVEPITGPDDFPRILKEVTRENGAFEEYIYLMSLSTEETENGAVFEGFLRGSGPDAYAKARAQVEGMMPRIVGDAGTYQITFGDLVLPDMHSNAELTMAAVPSIEAMVGDDRIIMVHASIPYFGEDFAFYQQHAPGAMFFLGGQNLEKGITSYNHFPDYDLDESVITVGTKVMAAVLVDWLRDN